MLLSLCVCVENWTAMFGLRPRALQKISILIGSPMQLTVTHVQHTCSSVRPFLRLYRNGFITLRLLPLPTVSQKPIRFDRLGHGGPVRNIRRQQKQRQHLRRLHLLHPLRLLSEQPRLPPLFPLRPLLPPLPPLPPSLHRPPHPRPRPVCMSRMLPKYKGLTIRTGKADCAFAVFRVLFLPTRRCPFPPHPAPPAFPYLPAAYFQPGRRCIHLPLCS